MATGEPRIGMAPIIVSSQAAVIVRAQVIDQVAVLELAAESLAIDQAAAQAQVIVRGPVPVLAIVPAVAPVLVIVPAAAEPEHDLAAAGLEHVPVEAALEHAPVAAAPERGPVAVRLKTKSVIVVHHHGRVPLLAAAVDLVVAAQTMREQAATEAVTAWGVADTAAVDTAE